MQIGAANRAALHAFIRLVKNAKKEGIKIDSRTATVFLDGDLFLESRVAQKGHAYRADTIIKGDEKISAVAAASISYARGALEVRLKGSHLLNVARSGGTADALGFLLSIQL